MVFQAEKSDTLAVRLEEEKGLRRKEQEETREEKLRSGEEYKSLCQRLGQEMEDTRKVSPKDLLQNSPHTALSALGMF